jgi:hypothetical protein
MAVTRIEALEAEPEAVVGTLYRALRRDVRFRFVMIGRDKATPYEVIREDGSVDEPGGTVLIDPFEVPDGRDDAFLTGWDSAHARLSGRPGYLGARLHRAVGPADFRFVEVARWSSPLAFSKALRTPASGFRSHPALYEIIRG